MDLRKRRSNTLHGPLTSSTLARPEPTSPSRRRMRSYARRRPDAQRQRSKTPSPASFSSPKQTKRQLATMKTPPIPHMTRFSSRSVPDKEASDASVLDNRRRQMTRRRMNSSFSPNESRSPGRHKSPVRLTRKEDRLLCTWSKIEIADWLQSHWSQQQTTTTTTTTTITEVSRVNHRKTTTKSTSTNRTASAKINHYIKRIKRDKKFDGKYVDKLNDRYLHILAQRCLGLKRGDSDYALFMDAMHELQATYSKQQHDKTSNSKASRKARKAVSSQTRDKHAHKRHKMHKSMDHAQTNSGSKRQRSHTHEVSTNKETIHKCKKTCKKRVKKIKKLTKTTRKTSKTTNLASSAPRTFRFNTPGLQNCLSQPSKYLDPCAMLHLSTTSPAAADANASPETSESELYESGPVRYEGVTSDELLQLIESGQCDEIESDYECHIEPISVQSLSSYIHEVHAPSPTLKASTSAKFRRLGPAKSKTTIVPSILTLSDAMSAGATCVSGGGDWDNVMGPPTICLSPNASQMADAMTMSPGGYYSMTDSSSDNDERHKTPSLSAFFHDIDCTLAQLSN